MTLGEAIKHCKEKAEELKNQYGELANKRPEPIEEQMRLLQEKHDCLACANEHEQLAKWLEDYKRLLGEKSYAMGYQDGLEDGLNDIRPKGEWIFSRCDKCGAYHNSMYRNFCPNCGADMRGDTKCEE